MDEDEVQEVIDMVDSWKAYVMENDDFLKDLLIQDVIVLADIILSDVILLDEALRSIDGKGIQERIDEADGDL